MTRNYLCRRFFVVVTLTLIYSTLSTYSNESILSSFENQPVSNVSNIINEAPVLGGIEVTNLLYNEGSGTISVSDSIAISDNDNISLQSAEIEISEGFKSDQDQLTFINSDGITGNWDTENGILTLIGEASITNYQTALRNIKYENTNTTNPSTVSRTVSFTVNDGFTASNTQARNISVVHTNIAPELGAIEGSALTYNEGAGKVSVTSSITVSDADHANLQRPR
ncbi:MAG: hypothetical protein HC905_11850 [Bacteroidales bacterium]|nr:hypothetical protein [Bacteroidales bacterium]